MPNRKSISTNSHSNSSNKRKRPLETDEGDLPSSASSTPEVPQGSTNIADEAFGKNLNSNLNPQVSDSDIDLTVNMKEGKDEEVDCFTDYALTNLQESLQTLGTVRTQLVEGRLLEINIEKLLERRKQYEMKSIEIQKDGVLDLALESNSSTEVIRLNVGGETFVVPISTLLSRESSSYFHSLIGCHSSGSPAPLFIHPDTDTVFIDRDPESFRFILNYLRGYGRLHMLTDRQLKMLKADAYYYNLQGLQNQLDSYLSSPKQGTFLSGPGVSNECNRLRSVYGLATIGRKFLVSGCHRITFEILRDDYVGIGVVSDACINRDQECHKTPYCCVYYMTGIFYTNFPNHRKEENLERIASKDFVSLTLDIDKRYIEYKLKGSTKMVSIGDARRLLFAVTLKLDSCVRIVPDEELPSIPLFQN